MSKEDFLTVDQQIPGQNYCVISFISPEKILKQKHDFIYWKFLKEFNDKDLNFTEFNERLEDFKLANKKTLTDEFNELTEFQTSVRGVKVRGTYETEKEAKVRAEVLRRRYPNDNIFVGQVGYWLPWDPDPLDVKDVEYQETELNILMKKYNENMEHREYMFEEERKTKIEQARKESNTEFNKETSEKIDEVRQIINEKDSLMNSVDPWMKKKEEEAKLRDNKLIEVNSESVIEEIIDNVVDSNFEPVPENTPEPIPENTPEPESQPSPES